MKTKGKRRPLSTAQFAVLGILAAILFLGLVRFTVITYHYQGRTTRILMFSRHWGPEVLTQSRGRVESYGWTIGRHVLETNYGEIVLRNLAPLVSGWHTLVSIPWDTFYRGLATHNLEVGGLCLPKNIELGFFNGTLYSASWEVHEAIIGDETFWFNRGVHRFNNEPGSIRFSGSPQKKSLILSDSTEISFLQQEWVGWRLIARTDYTWSIEALQRGRKYFFFVKHPGESEFRRYESITFQRDFGDFLLGELAEGITLGDMTRISYNDLGSGWGFDLLDRHDAATGHRIMTKTALNPTGFFSVKHPTEEEYRRYTSVTFLQYRGGGQNFGGFISGEPFVE